MDGLNDGIAWAMEMLCTVILGYFDSTVKVRSFSRIYVLYCYKEN